MSPRTDVVLTAEEQSRLGPRAVLLARAPSVVPSYDRLGNALANGLLDRSLRERVRLRCAGIVGCEYWQHVRHAVAGHEPLSEDEVARVSALAADLSTRDRAALRWADALLVHPDEIDADLRAEVARSFSDAELIELSHAITRFAGGSKMRILFGLTPPIAPGTVT